MDIQQSTNSNDILTDDLALDGGAFDPSLMEDLDLDGMDSKEFAMMVAETASAFLPGGEAEDFKRRYVAMVAPLLKFGGFEKLTAGMTLGGLVDRNPWIGALICSSATVLGLWVCWPRAPHYPQSLTPEQAEQIRRFQQARAVQEGEEESYA